MYIVLLGEYECEIIALTRLKFTCRCLACICCRLFRSPGLSSSACASKPIFETFSFNFSSYRMDALKNVRVISR